MEYNHFNLAEDWFWVFGVESSWKGVFTGHQEWEILNHDWGKMWEIIHA